MTQNLSNPSVHEFGAAPRQASGTKIVGDAIEGQRWNWPCCLHLGGRSEAYRGPCVCEEDAKDRARCGVEALEGVRFVTKQLQRIKRKMLRDRDVRAAYDASGVEFDLARELIAARMRAGMTQAEVAERMGTTQSVIARLESGTQMPSVSTLLKFAKATQSRPIIKLLAA